ncbi:hypothetical protein AB0L75_35670 [Streptomyces sp. NPDC052101]|uniref:hypothetical protein n=1 Tax=Streptomyces sp. NPDC052101 TaxID=3155763 RepID=UPI0034224320
MEVHGAGALDAAYPLQRLWRDIQHTYPPACALIRRSPGTAAGFLHLCWSTA